MPIDFNHHQGINAAESNVVTVTTTGNSTTVPTGIIHLVPADVSFPAVTFTGPNSVPGNSPWHMPINPISLDPPINSPQLVPFSFPPVSDADFEMMRQVLEARTLRALGIPREYLEDIKPSVAPVEEVAHPVEKKFRRMLEP